MTTSCDMRGRRKEKKMAGERGESKNNKQKQNEYISLDDDLS